MNTLDLLRRKLRGAYELDGNISFADVGSIFRPQPDTLVGDLTDRIQKMYNSVFSTIGTNGTTGANVLMIGAALHAGDDLIIERASHASIYGAMVIFGAKPYYLKTNTDPHFGLPLGASVEDVATALDAVPTAAAVVLTSPNYFGRVAPIRAITEESHRRHALCVVDAAHGAHFRASRLLPSPIESSGVDLCTHSVHKTGAALAQASLLHCFNPSDDLYSRFQMVTESIPVVSTSFSLPILFSIELAMAEFDETAKWSSAVESAIELGDRLGEIDGCRLVKLELPDPRVHEQDPMRVVLDVADTGIDGYRFAQLLAESRRDRHPQIVEMETARHLIFIVSSGVLRADIDRLVVAVARVVEEHRGPRLASPPAAPRSLPSMVLTPREAFEVRKRRRITVAEAVRGHFVAGETVATYPPGAPIFVAGELIGRAELDFLTEAHALGAHLKGNTDPTFRTITVIDS